MDGLPTMVIFHSKVFNYQRVTFKKCEDNHSYWSNSTHRKWIWINFDTLWQFSSFLFFHQSSIIMMEIMIIIMMIVIIVHKWLIMIIVRIVMLVIMIAIIYLIIPRKFPSSHHLPLTLPRRRSVNSRRNGWKSLRRGPWPIFSALAGDIMVI